MNSIRIVDIEDLSNKYDKHIHGIIDEPTLYDANSLIPFIDELTKSKFRIDELKRKYKKYMKNSFFYKCFKLLLLQHPHKYTENDHKIVRMKLMVKKGKSLSGIVSITIFTSAHPQYTKNGTTMKNNFSCKWNCHYCPNEPNQPRSYLKGEPGVMRANRNDFDCIRQMYDRMTTLYNNGHTIDKLEILVLGGTWESYPEEYRDEFIRDMYYASNTFPDTSMSREKYDLSTERDMNRKSRCRVIGLTLETRPDTINKTSLVKFREYGCTRLQLGIQHIDDDILRKINRGCLTLDAIRAIKLLKDCGFKVDGHWMPNLPGSSLEKDDYMFTRLLDVDKKVYDKNDNEKWTLSYPELQVDQWKIYPCTVVPYTKIAEWYKNNIYIPYNWESMTNLLLKVKSLVFPWIRLNRIVRDIPGTYSLNSDYDSNLRNELSETLETDGLQCRCIRCREIKDREFNRDYKIIKREYNASDGTEIFIEAQYNNIIYGFLRLRSCTDIGTYCFEELKNSTLIRELHVYGSLLSVGNYDNKCTQHRGVGKELLLEAFKLTKSRFNLKKISVISGEGVRDYYTKYGFIDLLGDGRFMTRCL